MKKLNVLIATTVIALALSLCGKAGAQPPGMDPQRLQNMMQLFQNMDPQQLENLRQISQNMDPEQRQAMTEEFQSMDPKQQQDVLQQFSKMDPQQVQNMNSQQMLSALQQRANDSLREQLGVTNDAEWSLIEVKVAAVKKARIALTSYSSGMMGGFGMGRGFGGGSQGSPELQALRAAKDSDTPAAQMRTLLANYRAARKEKQAALATAQDELRSLLTVRQTAIATLGGLLD